MNKTGRYLFFWGGGRKSKKMGDGYKRWLGKEEVSKGGGMGGSKRQGRGNGRGLQIVMGGGGKERN